MTTIHTASGRRRTWPFDRAFLLFPPCPATTDHSQAAAIVLCMSEDWSSPDRSCRHGNANAACEASKHGTREPTRPHSRQGEDLGEEKAEAVPASDCRERIPLPSQPPTAVPARFPTFPGKSGISLLIFSRDGAQPQQAERNCVKPKSVTRLVMSMGVAAPMHARGTVGSPPDHRGDSLAVVGSWVSCIFQADWQCLPSPSVIAMLPYDLCPMITHFDAGSQWAMRRYPENHCPVVWRRLGRC
jgi:hypothetical protein